MGYENNTYIFYRIRKFIYVGILRQVSQIIILIILAFVIGIFDFKFTLECKKEQKNNKAGAFIYVGDKKIIWIFGILFYIISVLEWAILSFSIEIASLFLFLFFYCMFQLGFATFLCQHFTYSAVFIKEKRKISQSSRLLGLVQCREMWHICFLMKKRKDCLNFK